MKRLFAQLIDILIVVLLLTFIIRACDRRHEPAVAEDRPRCKAEREGRPCPFRQALEQDLAPKSPAWEVRPQRIVNAPQAVSE